MRSYFPVLLGHQFLDIAMISTESERDNCAQALDEKGPKHQLVWIYLMSIGLCQLTTEEDQTQNRLIRVWLAGIQ